MASPAHSRCGSSVHQPGRACLPLSTQQTEPPAMNTPSPNRNTPTMVILAGGTSSRMAPLQDKLLLRFGPEPLLLSQLRRYQSLGFEHIVIVISPSLHDDVARMLKQFRQQPAHRHGDTGRSAGHGRRHHHRQAASGRGRAGLRHAGARHRRRQPAQHHPAGLPQRPDPRLHRRQNDGYLFPRRLPGRQR